MKILKRILMVLAALVAFVLILALVAPKSYSVEREITINQPLDSVFNYVKYLKNQDNFSVWATMDANMKKEYRGTDGVPGFVSAWESESKDVGKGEQEIMKIADGKRIDFEIRFMKPFESTDYAYMTTDAVNDSVTDVKWGFSGKMPYPMNLMLLFMSMDEMVGKDLGTGLENLKSVLEKN